MDGVTLYRRAATSFALGVVALALTAGPAASAPPPGLPRYDLDIHLDTAGHLVHVFQRVIWTNRHKRAAGELIFNAHSHYQLPDKDVGMTAKIFEILRMMPGETLDLEGHALDVRRVYLLGASWGEPTPLPTLRQTASDELPTPRPLPAETPPPAPARPFDRPIILSSHYQEDNDTALVVPLPRPVACGETVTVELEFVLRLPQIQGRWGQWAGVTFLTNWLPLLAYYDDNGWQPTPYVVWHQPFFNEAGVFTTRLSLPADQKVACTSSVQSQRELPDGRRQIDFAPILGRDFAILCSPRYKEFLGKAGPIRVRCLAAPENERYARFMVDSACEALTTFTRWFGPYPYPEFTIAEAFFGWHSNECAGLIMIDSRIFRMPHVAQAFVDYLVSQATCHQWWYNVVGTHGYKETWMDEGPATYFAYRLMRTKYGHNDPLAKYPSALKWLPNVRRNDYRYFNLYGTLARGEAQPTVQDIPKFGHIIDLYSMCYERGSKIIGMIEHALGEKTFFEFMQMVYQRHYFRILRVADFQHDLEEFTHQSWQSFFDKWVYGAGLSDWCVKKVTIEPLPSWRIHNPPPAPDAPGPRARSWFKKAPAPCKVTVLLQQKAEITDPTVLAFSLDGTENYKIRIPINPEAGLVERSEPTTRIEPLPKNRVRVEVELPSAPTQVAVDPDEILVDANPTNNYWKPRCRVRFSPVYTFLDETDLTNSYDRWNLIFGPWVFAPTYDNPWFTRSTRFGFRAGAYRTARFEGGVYAAYRTDYRDFVEGVDCILDHWPWNHTEVGFVAERRLVGTLRGENQANRGVVYGRYVIDYGDSLYLPPFQYVEGFATIQDDLLPFARETLPDATRFLHQSMGGLHYHINYLTPYWDPEGGFSADLSYAGGLELPGEHEGINGSQQLLGQATYVQSMPDGFGWLSDTRLAFRLYGAWGLPNNVQYFALGGSELFRGFDLAQRQGNMLWVGSAEWRVPVIPHLHWSLCDRALCIENVNAAFFTDVGNIYLLGQSVGGFAQAVGAGLRLDVSWFTFVERTIFRLDFARTVNSAAPMQIWAGIEHPF
jgi:hypothetical protein